MFLNRVFKRLKETEEELIRKAHCDVQSVQAMVKHERLLLNEEKVKHRALLSKQRMAHAKERDQQLSRLDERERAMKQKEIDSERGLQVKTAQLMKERLADVAIREKMVEEQLVELREWEASLLYPSGGGGGRGGG